jgi:hypothetical protein
MQCPICGNTITFPAVPPTKGGKIIADETPKPRRKWNGNIGGIFVYLRDYPHWDTVGQIMVPFVIIGALLAGALWVKNKFTEEPASGPAPIVQGEGGGWDKMTEMARVDQRMQQYVQSIILTKKAVTSASRALEAEQKRLAEARDPDEKQAISANVQSYERALNQTQNKLSSLQQHFQTDYEKYRNMGGTIDYISRVPY